MSGNNAIRYNDWVYKGTIIKDKRRKETEDGENKDKRERQKRRERWKKREIERKIKSFVNSISEILICKFIKDT